MKKINFLWMGAAALAILTTGCVKDVVKGPKGSDESNSVVVSIKSEPAGTRGILGPSTTDQIAKYESNIVEFTAYLFNDTGAFLEQKSTSAGSKQIVFPGYETDDKIQVVAIANSEVAHVSVPTLTVGSSTIADVTKDNLVLTVPLSSQTTDDFTDLENGLMMSGRYGADPATGNMPADPNAAIYTVKDGTNKVEVPVERVVARVELGEITFASTVTIADIIRFQVTGAGIQRAIGSAYIYPGEIDTYPSSPTYYGSFSGGGSTSTIAAGLVAMGQSDTGLLNISGLVTSLLEAVKDNLSALGIPDVLGATTTLLNLAISAVETVLNGSLLGIDTLLGYLDIPLSTILALPGVSINLGEVLATPNNFWYVLPNNNPMIPTLLTLEGTYDGEDYFYPVAINAVDNDGEPEGDTTDGTNIKRNMRYIINIEFEDFYGTDNPDDPAMGTNLIVTVKPVPWEGPINQVTTW